MESNSAVADIFQSQRSVRNLGCQVSKDKSIRTMESVKEKTEKEKKKRSFLDKSVSNCLWNAGGKVVVVETGFLPPLNHTGP